ncbi:MAG: type II toxin-antitoxin system Phd/YefM family antitoxin [Alphaproteobacteria bacterium]
MRRFAWKLEDAKARFSEVVRLAEREGPQRVTRRGKDAVVVISAAAFDRMQPTAAPPLGLVEFLERSGLDALDLRRADDRGREIEW